GTIPRFASDGSLANLPRSTSFSPNWTRWSRQSDTSYAVLEHKFSEDWSFKAIANHSEGDSMSLRTYATGYANPATGAGLKLLAGVGVSWERRDSLDLYTTGKFSLFGRDHDLVIGANGVRTKAVTPTLTSVASWSYDIPDIRSWDGSAPAPTYSRTGAKRIAITEQSGAFASARWRVTEPLSVITGVRVSTWETKTDAYNAAGTYTATTGAYKVKDEVTPYVGLVYDVSEALSLYASYTDIFKPQNYKDKDNNLLSPVSGSNTEVGVKAELLDKRLAMSFAVFEAKQDNYAVRDASQPEGSLPDGSSAYIGVNGTKSKGFEFDVAGQLAQGWTLNAGYTNIRITRHPNDLIYANLPRHSVQLSTSYRLPGDWNRLTVGGGVNWQSEVVGFGIPHPLLGAVTAVQPSYALVQLNANWRLNERFSLNVSVRNLLDKAYWANLDYPNYGDPRSVLLSVRGRF
ncbi:MAG: TonB-dependent receptor, partial [Burkholderiaceae bacterium]